MANKVQKNTRTRKLNSKLIVSSLDNLLAPPVYTRPAEFRGWKVPDVLLSGDPKTVEDWRHEEALRRTEERRPGMMKE